MSGKKGKKKRALPFANMEAVMARTFAANNMGGFIRQWRLLKIWKEVVGDKLFQKTEPAYVKDDVLFVKVADPSWTHELSFLKDEVLAKLKRGLKGRAIKDIRFFSGSVRPLYMKSKKEFDISEIEIDEKRVKESMNYGALKKRPELQGICEKFIRNSFRRGKYLNDEQSKRPKE